MLFTTPLEVALAVALAFTLLVVWRYRIAVKEYEARLAWWRELLEECANEPQQNQS